jgi:2-polyprenyl-3-methyl-5-hydroxy-6-metoxy-1,4-benzoquinol methylase
MKNTTTGHPTYKENLDCFTPEYLDPDPSRQVDQKILGMVIDRVMPNLEGPSVLEMGCGDGQWTGPIIQKFGSTSVVDASAKLLDAARNNFGSKIISHQSYFEDFKPSQKWDTVLCTYVLEHVVDPVQVLKSCYQWLKPGGQLVVAVPNSSSLHRRLGVVMGLQKEATDLSPADRSVGHRRVYNAASLQEDLLAAGFVIEKQDCLCCKILPNSMMVSFSDQLLQGLFDLGDIIEKDECALLAFYCRTHETV